MADNEKSALLTVGLDIGDFEKVQAALQSRINEVNNAQLKLDAGSKENQKTFAENKKVLSILDQQMKINQKALNELTDAEKKNTDTTNFSNNSIKQNRELLKSLSSEYIRIQQPTKEQTQRVLELTNELKKQESAIGDNRRNVGNYAESLKGALSEGLKSGAAGLKGFNTALTASPIGLVTQGIQLLTSAFGGIQPVVDFLEQKISALTAAFKAIVGGVAGFVGALFSGSSVTQAYSENIDGLGDSISQAAIEANNLTKAIQELEDAESEALVTTAKNNQEISKLLISSKDRTKDQKERLALLDQAGKKEQENFNIELANSKERERIAKATLERVRKERQDDGEALKAARQAEADRINLETSSANLLETISNRKNLLIQNEAAERQKAADQRKVQLDKEAAEEEKRAKENIERLKNLAIQRTEIDKQLAAIRKGIRDQEEQQQFDQRLKEQEQRDQAIEARKVEYAFYLENLQLEAETFEEVQDQKTQALKDANEVALNDITLSEEKKKNIILKNNKAIQAIEKETVKARIQGFDAVANTLAGIGELLGEQTEVGKALAIASTTISTYTAAQKAYEAMIGIPVVGPILAPLASGVAIAQGLLRVKQINDVKVEGFADSGVVGKVLSSHGTSIKRSNGDDRFITAKTGEVVLNKKHQNMLGGDSTFAAIGVPGFADSGVVESIRQSTNQADVLTAENIKQAISELNIYTSVTEIRDVLDTLDLQTKVAEL